MFRDSPVWVRGAGELGSATAVVLRRAGFPVLLSERRPPLAIRRTVAFSDAIINGEAAVEGIRAVRAAMNTFRKVLSRGELPVMDDEEMLQSNFETEILVDARMLKRNVENQQSLVSFVIGLGPGFQVGSNCHIAVETMRGHHLGRLFREGSPQPDTGIPAERDGEDTRRVCRAPAVGKLKWDIQIGTTVNESDLLGLVDEEHEILAPLRGVVRGLISETVPMTEGLKIADVDPRLDVNCNTISDKALAVGRAVLEAVIVHLNAGNIPKQ